MANSNFDFIAQQIADNINVKELTPKSKLNLIAKSLLAESTTYTKYGQEAVKNMYIQTADDDYTELLGASEGLTRYNEPVIRVEKEDQILFLRFTEDKFDRTILPIGYKIDLVPNNSWIELIEPVDLSLVSNALIYISADLKVSNDTNNYSFSEGASFPIKINNINYEIGFNSEVTVPIITESLDNYKARIIFSKTSTKTGSNNAIRLALSSINFIDDFSIDYNTDPYTINIFNYNLLNDSSYIDLLNLSTIPLVYSRLKRVISEGTTFQVSLPKQVNFTLELKANKPNPANVDSIINNLISYIQNLYRVGVELTIDKDLIFNFCKKNNIETGFLADYDLLIYKNFLGESYLSSLNYITVLNDEYPYINEVRINVLY